MHHIRINRLLRLFAVTISVSVWLTWIVVYGIIQRRQPSVHWVTVTITRDCGTIWQQCVRLNGPSVNLKVAERLAIHRNGGSAVVHPGQRVKVPVLK